MAVPLSFMNLSRASAWATVRGKPSKRKPLAFGFLSSSSLSMAIVISSGTSAPLFMISFTFLPRVVSFFVCQRKRSPVEICTKLYFAMSFSLCVPFPAPGGPNSTRFTMVFLGTNCEDVKSDPYVQVLEISAQSIVVEAISHNELFFELETHIFHGNVLLPRGLLAEKRDGLDRLSTAVFQLFTDALQGEPRVDNVLNDEDVLVEQIG